MRGRWARPLTSTALLGLAATACIQAPLPTRFYVLTAPPPSNPPAGSSADLAVGVGPIALPDYLNRTEIVTRGGGDEIELAEFDHWGEPLRSAVPRILAEDLAARIPTERVVVFPWRGVRTVQYQVTVEILRLDGKPGGDAVLRARWRLLDGAGRELAIRTSAVTEATGASGYAPLVAALSRALATLSDEMAGAIRSAAR
jgi:uncharacterized lipoprotein YmbA